MNARQLLLERIRQSLRELGAAEDTIIARGLPIFADARRLMPAGLGTDGRDKFLAPPAAMAWLAMREAAWNDGVELLLVSAFRSFDFQLGLIRGKLAKGRSIDDVLSVNAPPGCSEHHTGRAVDVGCAGTPPLEEDFESTPAFAWLQRRAADFGFELSFPRNNPYGYLYEPWHWCYRPPQRTAKVRAALSGARPRRAAA
jgi:D-alanyl-D-alanine carboxypeptidase